MKRSLVLCLLSGALGGSALGQASANEKSLQNLRDCLAGFGNCDRSLLTTDAKRQRNALACVTGWGVCDRSLLDAEQAKHTETKPSL